MLTKFTFNKLRYIYLTRAKYFLVYTVKKIQKVFRSLKSITENSLCEKKFDKF